MVRSSVFTSVAGVSPSLAGAGVSDGAAGVPAAVTADTLLGLLRSIRAEGRGAVAFNALSTLPRNCCVADSYISNAI